jgi:hypothetical protein
MATQDIECGRRIYLISVRRDAHRWVADRGRIFLSRASARNAFRTLSAVPGNAGAVRYVADEYAPEVYGDAEVVP